MSKSSTDLHWSDRAASVADDVEVNIMDVFQRELEYDHVCRWDCLVWVWVSLILTQFILCTKGQSAAVYTMLRRTASRCEHEGESPL